jgi:hypothetical protein
MRKDWKDVDGAVASVEEFPTRGGTRYSVVFTYKVDGEWYGGTFTTDESYSKDDMIAVLYDPSKPERNNLVEEEKIRHWIIGAILSVVALFILYAVFIRDGSGR